MNTKLTNGSICAVVFGAWVGAASALSLGPVSGSTVVGRPLELTAPIRFDELAQGNGSGCVTAQVLYGDKALKSEKVQVDLSADAARQVSYARISSVAVVDEPIVTLVLHAGCGRQMTRRYVLLAEAPRDELRIAGAVAPLALASSAQLTPIQTARPATDGLALRPTRVAEAVRPQRPPAVRPGAMVPDQIRNRSAGRLQLALWDPNAEQLPWLRASMELRSSPSADAAHRAAATALWRALNAQPQDLLRMADRLRGLEGEVSSLRALSNRHRSEISSAREALQSSRSQRHFSLLLAAVLALLAGGSAAFFWHRSRRAGEAVQADSWYGPLEPLGAADGVVEEEQKPLPAAVRAAVVETPAALPRQAVVPPKESVQVASPRAPMPEPLLTPLEFSLPAAATPPTAQVQDQTGLKVEALHGAQQQSEFFASLGQVDEAVAVLTSYLEESSEKPVLAFLELFRIYHGTGMRVEYEELQTTFRQTFGMDVPSFGEYRQENRELELYLVPLTRIAAGWPSEHSQDIIEDLLFKRPATPRDMLSLEAYRELLWLYSLGQEIVHNTGVPAGLQLLGDRGLSNDHFILPWAIDQQDGPSELSLERLTSIDVAPELNAFAVDIDLSGSRGGTPQQPVPEAPQQATLEPKVAPARSSDIDAFDAVMESESRRHFR